MAEDFDPYYKWLGIGPEERPASHYRLLAIREFEPDPEVIQSAADRQMSHVRSFQTGPHSADSQRLLNELSAARLCLLNPAKKAFYDGELQRLRAAAQAAEVAKPLPVAIVAAPPPSATVEKREVLSDIISSSPGRQTHPAVERTHSWRGPVIAALVTTVMVLGAGLAYRLIFYREVSVAPRVSAKRASSGEPSQSRDQTAGEAAGSKAGKLEPEGRDENPAALSATSTDLVPPRPAEDTGLPENVWIRIVNRSSRMGIGVREDKKSPGTDVIQWDAGAEWILRPQGDFWSIRDRNSGLYLAVMKSSREQGAAICVESKGNASSQWTIEPTDPPFWKILNRNSGLALAIPQGQRNRGAVACQWPSWSGSDQQWEFKVEAPGSSEPLAKSAFDVKQAQEYQQRWAQKLRVPLEITNSIGMKLVLIPPGEFEMGSPKELTEEESNRPNVEWFYRVRLPGEGPRHHVRITQPFYLGVYDVTQGEYQHVIGANPSEFSATGKGKDKVAGRDTKRFPVENVSWDDSAEFCRKLSELPAEKAAGRRYHLPTEAQWEYACRAGSTGRFGFSMSSRTISREDDEQALEDYGWFASNSGGVTHPVGLKRANAWGLYDMHGNVWEWCQDCYDTGYYGKSPVDDPSGPPDAASHVNRGGSWPYPSRFCRSACRDGGNAGDAGDRTRGLRVSSVTLDMIGKAEQKRPAAAEDGHRSAADSAVGLPRSDADTAAQAASGSRAPTQPKVLPPLVIDLQEPLAHCTVEMDELPKGTILLEITKLEGSGDFDKDVTIEKPRPLRPGSSGSLGLALKGCPNKVSLALVFAMNTEGKGFDISLKVGPKIVAACKNPPANIEAAKSDIRRKRDVARGNMERAKTSKEKHAVAHTVEAYDRALASLQFFSEVNKVKVHFRVCLDAGDGKQTALVTTEAP